MEESDVLEIAEEGELGLLEREDEEKAKGKKNCKWKNKWERNHGQKQTQQRQRTEIETETDFGVYSFLCSSGLKLDNEIFLRWVCLGSGKMDEIGVWMVGK